MWRVLKSSCFHALLMFCLFKAYVCVSYTFENTSQRRFEGSIKSQSCDYLIASPRVAATLTRGRAPSGATFTGSVGGTDDHAPPTNMPSKYAALKKEHERRELMQMLPKIHSRLQAAVTHHPKEPCVHAPRPPASVCVCVV